MPKVSVIMPAYNAEKYIGEAIDSILAQTFVDFEFIILNDCSTDRTEEIILSYCDPRIVYLKNEKNLGVAATLNRGLDLACGEYIARMDADDISLPERFAKQVAYLDKHGSTAVLGTALELFDENGVISSRWSSVDAKQMKVDLFFSCGLAHPSVMMRRDVVQSFGGYDVRFEGLEDYHLWCRISGRYDVVTLPDLLFRYRVHSAQVTQNPSAKHRERMRRLKTWQLEQLGLPTEGRLAERFYDWCAGKHPVNAEELLELEAFFLAAIKANNEVSAYDAALFRSNFRSVLINELARMDKRERADICKRMELVSRWNVEVSLLKQKIRRLLP